MEDISLNLRGRTQFQTKQREDFQRRETGLEALFFPPRAQDARQRKIAFRDVGSQNREQRNFAQALRSESLPDGRIRGGSRKRLRTARVQRAGGRDPVSLSQGGGHQSHGRGVRRAARSARGGRRALSRGQGTARSLSELIFTSATQSEKWVKKAGGLLIV